MSGWRQVAIIARRDFVQRATSKPFLFTMALIVGLVLVTGPLLADAGQPDPARQVGVVGEPSATFTASVQAFAAQVELEPELVGMDDVASGQDQLAAGDVDVVLVLEPPPGALVWQSEPDLRLATVLTGALRADAQQRAAAETGLSPSQAQRLLAPEAPSVEIVEPTDPRDTAEEAAVFVGVLLLYISVILFGQFVMLAVVEEKSSRVVEVILSRVLPYRLLAGKVIGIGVLAVVQIVLLAAALYVVARQVVPEEEFDFAVGIGLLASIVGWFLVGFAFYAVLYAALGSTVTRQEDMQSVALLPLLFVLPGYFIATFATGNPDGLLPTIASILPPTSPFVMPVRSAVGEVPPWQLGLSVALLLAATYGMIRLAGRIYSGAILSIGAKVSLREAWRSSAHVPSE